VTSLPYSFEGTWGKAKASQEHARRVAGSMRGVGMRRLSFGGRSVLGRAGAEIGAFRKPQYKRPIYIRHSPRSITLRLASRSMVCGGHGRRGYRQNIRVGVQAACRDRTSRLRPATAKPALPLPRLWSIVCAALHEPGWKTRPTRNIFGVGWILTDDLTGTDSLPDFRKSGDRAQYASTFKQGTIARRTPKQVAAKPASMYVLEGKRRRGRSG